MTGVETPETASVPTNSTFSLTVKEVLLNEGTPGSGIALEEAAVPN